MAAKFEIYQDASGKFRWRLKAGNGEVVATGQSYTSKAAAQRGATAAQKAAAKAHFVALVD